MMINEVRKEKTMLEKHYTSGELAKKWGFSAQFVRELFEREEGVLVIDRPERMHKRGYVLLRIPESVAERVYTRLVKVKRPTLRAAARPALDMPEPRRA